MKSPFCRSARFSPVRVSRPVYYVVCVGGEKSRSYANTLFLPDWQRKKKKKRPILSPHSRQAKRREKRVVCRYLRPPFSSRKREKRPLFRGTKEQVSERMKGRIWSVVFWFPIAIFERFTQKACILALSVFNNWKNDNCCMLLKFHVTWAYKFMILRTADGLWRSSKAFYVTHNSFVLSDDIIVSVDTTFSCSNCTDAVTHRPLDSST